MHFYGTNLLDYLLKPLYPYHNERTPSTDSALRDTEQISKSHDNQISNLSREAGKRVVLVVYHLNKRQGHITTLMRK